MDGYFRSERQTGADKCRCIGTVQVQLATLEGRRTRCRCYKWCTDGSPGCEGPYPLTPTLPVPTSITNAPRPTCLSAMTLGEICPAVRPAMRDEEGACGRCTWSLAESPRGERVQQVSAVGQWYRGVVYYFRKLLPTQS